MSNDVKLPLPGAHCGDRFIGTRLLSAAGNGPLIWAFHTTSCACFTNVSDVCCLCTVTYVSLISVKGVYEKNNLDN